MKAQNFNWSIPNALVVSGTVSMRTALGEFKKSTVDDELAQRIFVDWDKERKQSYVASLLSGENLTSLFVLADLHSIITAIESDIQSVKESAEDGQQVDVLLETLIENQTYFQELVDSGMKYLMLDGKHRAELLNSVFVEKDFMFDNSYFDGEAPFTDYVRLNGVSISLHKKTLADVDKSLTDFLLDNTQVLITIVKNGKIEDMQKIFVKTNSGLQLLPMELRICTQSDMARFVRSLGSAVNNPTINRFFKKLKAVNPNNHNGAKSLKKKGDLLMLTQIIAYYINNISTIGNGKIDYTTDAYFDSMFRYDFPTISKSSKKMIREMIHIIAVGALEEYRKSEWVTLKWTDVINLTLITMHLCTGNLNELKVAGKKVKVNEDCEREFFRTLFDCMVHLHKLDYYELDENDNRIQRKDRTTGELMVDKKGNPIYVQNEHSFARKNKIMTPENLISRMSKFEDYIRDNSIIEDMVNRDIITLIDSSRTLSLNDKRYQAIVKQKSRDIFTGNRLSLGEIDSNKTSNCHVVAHSKGGSTMVVGNAKANLKSKTDTIYSEV